MSAHQIIISIILVVGLALYVRHRWLEYGKRYRAEIAPENEMRCLEELAEEHRLGKRDNSKLIEEQISIVEKDYPGRFTRRLTAVREDLTEGNARRNHLLRRDPSK